MLLGNLRLHCVCTWTVQCKIHKNFKKTLRRHNSRRVSVSGRFSLFLLRVLEKRETER